MNTQSDRIAQSLINVKQLLQNFTIELGGLGQPPF